MKEVHVPQLFVPSLNLLSMSAGEQSEARAILSGLLKTQQRQLTPEQWEYVMQQVAQEPTALYLCIVARIVVDW